MTGNSRALVPLAIKCVALVIIFCSVLALVQIQSPDLLRIVTVTTFGREKTGVPGLAANDPQVVEHIRQHVIVLPATGPYNLHYGVNFDPSDGQSKIIDRLLEKKRNGFYIESGGYTGEVLSNTLFFETQRNWSGLLIEPSRELFDRIVGRNRKVYLANACIGEANITKEVIFSNAKYAGRIVHLKSMAFGNGAALTQVECFPLYSFLLSLGNPTVDYFSLDVEGSEYKILQSIPWDRVDIKTLSVEYNLIPEGAQALLELMKSKGYIHYMTYARPYTHDYIFVKPEVLNTQSQDHQKLPIVDSNFSRVWAARWDLAS